MTGAMTGVGALLLGPSACDRAQGRRSTLRRFGWSSSSRSAWWVRQGRFDELPLPGDSSWLKITRAGDVFTPSVSLDGQTWKTLPDIRTQAWPADLEAGIVAVNDTKVTFAPAFHDLLVNGKAPE